MLEMNSSVKVEKEYHLKCEVRMKRKYYFDKDKNDVEFKASTTMFYLVPKESTHRVLFFDAWLPSVETECYEVVGVISTPINKVARLGFMMANKDCQEPHLVVMTVAVEDEIKKYDEWCRKNNSGSKYPELNISIQPQSDEENYDV